MVNWYLTWKFDRVKYSPKDSGYVHLWLENRSDADIYIPQAGVEFDWQDGYWYSQKCNIWLVPGQRKHLTSFSFAVPENVIGTRTCKFGIETAELYASSLINHGVLWVDGEGEICIGVSPQYRAFVSRGARPEETSKIDPIEQVLRVWGFNTYTYMGPNSPIVPYVIRQEMEAADCLILIATKRFMDTTTAIWQTSPWLHREFGMGFAGYKPTLIISEQDVYFDGLLSPTLPTIMFDSTPEAVRRVNDYMPKFREEVRAWKNKQARTNIAKIAVPVGAAFLVGVSIGRSR